MSVCEPHPFDQRAVLVGDRHGVHGERTVHAVAAPHALHGHQLAATRQGFAPCLERGARVVWVDRLEPAHLGDFVVALAGERAPAALLTARAAIRRKGPDDAGGGQQYRLEAVFTGGQPCRGFLALGDVEHAADHADHRAFAIAHQHAVVPDPHVVAVPVAHAILAGQVVHFAVAAGYVRHARGQRQRAILGMHQVFPPAADG